MSKSNYYLLLGLDPSVESKSAIEAAIAKKRSEWASESTYSPYEEVKTEAKANIECLDDIAEVMLKNPAERRKHAKECRDLVKAKELKDRELLRDAVKILSASGHLLDKDFKELLKRFSQFNEAEILAEIKVKIVEKAPKHEKEYMPDGEFQTMVTLLEKLGKRDLYELLGKRQDAPDSELQDAANKRLVELQRNSNKDAQLDREKGLVQSCLNLFQKKNLRERYDNSRERYPIQRVLHTDAKRYLKSHGTFSPTVTDALLDLAVKQGLDRKQAADYLYWLEQQGGGKAGVETPDQKAQKCSSCQHQNDGGARACTKCGHALLESCPKCGSDTPTADPVCWKCGYSEKEATEYRSYLAEARSLVSKGRLADARTRLGHARRLLPEAVEVKTIANEIDDQELRQLLATAQSALESGQLDDAADCLTRAGALRSDDPRLVTLRKDVAGRRTASGSLSALEESIRKWTSERRILQAWDSLEQVGGHPDAKTHQPRVNLARSRIQAVDAMRGLAEDFVGDDEFEKKLAPLIESKTDSSLKLESCLDTEVLQLDARLKGTRTRLKNVHILRDLLNQADRGQAVEADIAERGRSLSDDYYPELSLRVRLAKQLSAKEVDAAEFTSLWERIRSSPFEPKHPSIIDRCELIVATLKVTQVLNGLSDGENEADDREFARSYKSDGLSKADVDGRLARRYSATDARLKALNELRRAVNDADAGDRPEQAIVDAANAAKLPANYHYDLQARVAIAAALAAVPRSDRRLAQVWKQYGEGVSSPMWPDTVRDIQRAVQRTNLLDRIVAIQGDLPLEDRDAAIVELWDKSLLKGCLDAEMFQVDYEAAQIRRNTWEKVCECLDQGGDPRSLDRWLRLISDYGCLSNRQPKIDEMLGQIKELKPLLDALEFGDGDAFVENFKPELINSHLAAFEFFMPEIEQLVRERVLNRVQVIPAEQAWSLDSDGRNLQLHWSAQPREYIELSTFSTSDERFFNQVEEAQEQLRDVETVGGSGVRVPAPHGSKRIYVTIWPVVKIGPSRLYGRPAHVGPISALRENDKPQEADGPAPGLVTRVKGLVGRILYKLTNS